MMDKAVFYAEILADSDFMYVFSRALAVDEVCLSLLQWEKGDRVSGG